MGLWGCISCCTTGFRSRNVREYIMRYFGSRHHCIAVLPMQSPPGQQLNANNLKSSYIIAKMWNFRLYLPTGGLGVQAARPIRNLSGLLLTITTPMHVVIWPCSSVHLNAKVLSKPNIKQGSLLLNLASSLLSLRISTLYFHAIIANL